MQIGWSHIDPRIEDRAYTRDMRIVSWMLWSIKWKGKPTDLSKSGMHSTLTASSALNSLAEILGATLDGVVRGVMALQNGRLSGWNVLTTNLETME
jgi:hypothetical protein